jgi:hypothetical protein
VVHTAGRATMAGGGVGGEGSTSVMVVEVGGARSLGRENCLFEKGKDANLSEERGLLLWSRGSEEGEAATRTWTSPSC